MQHCGQKTIHSPAQYSLTVQHCGLKHHSFLTLLHVRVAEQGHQVVGCEYAPQAGPLFAKNMKLSFAESDDAERDGKIFKYKEADVKMYCCDIYKFTRFVQACDEL